MATNIPESEITSKPKPTVNYGGLPVSDTLVESSSPKPVINYGGLPVTDPNVPSPIKSISDEPIAGPNVSDLISKEIENTPIPNITELAKSVSTFQDATQFNAREDWRVRLALTDDTSANYLYKSENPGILAPLKKTNGVIFPYTPSISVNYSAKYDESNLVHSNYKIYQYSNSAVEMVQINGEFTAQDTYEANYLLAVIHFFRSMTKMFYGQDQDPKRGTPPPLCYLFGMGTFQFSAHPLVITGFSYNLPVDVDYIKTVSTYQPGEEQSSSLTQTQPTRLSNTGVGAGGQPVQPNWSELSSNQTGFVTWVPTRIQMSVSCLPIQSRNQISNKFSLKDYASGKLIDGVHSTGTAGGGFW